MTLLNSISRSDAVTRSGAGRLAVEVVANKSAATFVEARSPLKILVPRPRGQSVWAYMSAFGGGLLDGDEIDFEVSVGNGARCFLSTQASTKIYRGAAKNLFRAEVGSDALLVYAPDVSQGFAKSTFNQKQSIRLADETSKLIFLDWYSAGRAARGERWSFAEHTSRSDIFVGNRPVFIDSVRLNDCHEHFGRINCVAALVLIGFNTGAADEAITKRPDVLEISSAIAGGSAFRFAGVSVEAVARKVRARVDFVSELLGDNPFQRKW